MLCEDRQLQVHWPCLQSPQHSYQSIFGVAGVEPDAVTVVVPINFVIEQTESITLLTGMDPSTHRIQA